MRRLRLALGITMTRNVSQSTLATLPSYEGRQAIYIERMRVCRVRVVRIQVDDAHLFAKCETVETPGLNSAGASWNIAAGTDILTVKATYWSASYVGWQIFFNPTVIQRVLEIVSELPLGKIYLDDYTSRPVPSTSKFVSINTPGPYASELFSYLRAQQLVEL